jgi:mono/diheme cytochrome c family protein
VYKPDARGEAMIAGRQALDKFNCAGCHMLNAEKLKVAFAPGAFGDQPEVKAYPFLSAHYSPDQLDASKKLDHRGMLNATLSGMPAERKRLGR